MKIGFYVRLAWDGIRKNRKLYLPYLLTCAGMVMMFYIIAFLSSTPALETMSGGTQLGSILSMGRLVIAAFAVLFLFYSNSFLIRRRKREFGLYNILGMNKGNIGKILFWESVIAAVLSLALGMAVGIGLSKLFELGLVNMMSGTVSYTFSISGFGVVQTVVIFGVIFALLFLNGLRQVSLSNPVALMRSESAGEKPPKANWVLGIGGAVILAVAYYLAVTIQDPLTALVVFFAAVVMVILATYLLFIAGSVVLCRLLQRNTRYYYQARHFVSVSSMTYRMKRNGAGLASICILLTMVLVMVSSTTALFFGMEDSLRTRYPNDIALDVTFQGPKDATDEALKGYRAELDTVFSNRGVKPEQVQDYRYAILTGLLKDGVLQWDVSKLARLDTQTYSDLTQVYFVPLSDYNRTTGEQQTLEPNEVLVYSSQVSYDAPTFQVAEGGTYQVKAVLNRFWESKSATLNTVPSVYVVVPDFQSVVRPFTQPKNEGEDPMLYANWHYAFDLDLPAEQQVDFYPAFQAKADAVRLRHADAIDHVIVSCREVNRSYFYGVYGGLFFLGLMLSAVFLTAAVLIIYYKQISEGYEDQDRFAIMQKVGMTRREIRQSINSQMLTVFFLPLVTAGIHLCFAFPVIRQLLMLFNLWNTRLLVTTTVLCFLVFGLLYTLVYRVTSNAYFSIVSGARVGE